MTSESPIDFFDPCLTPCPNGLRKRCIALVHDASLESACKDDLEDCIEDPELTEAQGLELASYLEQHQKQLDEYYAPSQKMISKHIMMICGL